VYYYYEELDFAGCRRPRTSSVKPTEAKAEGGIRRIFNLCEVPTEMEHFTLDQLQKWLGQKDEGDDTSNKEGINV